MSAASANSSRRDCWLIPLIALLTVALVAIAGELVARACFHESLTGMGACLDVSDPAQGVRGRPLTICHEKSFESDDVEFRFDEMGYRNDQALGAPRPGVYRVVLIGSSVAMGERVSAAGSPATLLRQHLTTLTGSQVEVYNQGMVWGFARNAALHFQDSLDARPDLIVWLVTPLDVARSEVTVPEVAVPQAPDAADSKARVLRYIRAQGGDIVVGHLLRHYLYEAQSADQFVRAALRGQSPDDESGFLLARPGAAWLRHWDDFAGHARDIISRARTAGIPLAVTFVPNRLQAAMLSAGVWPDGYAPGDIDRRVQQIVATAGGSFIDVLPRFAAVPGAEHFYLALDGHPTPAGYRFICEAIALELTAGAVPGLTRGRRDLP